jgi:hypothetical protein
MKGAKKALEKLKKRRRNDVSIVLIVDDDEHVWRTASVTGLMARVC